MEQAGFAAELRRLRGAVAPAAIGLPAGGRRRTGGLRREELAALAGISVDYLTRLEQGRAESPSAQVVEALARSLRVDRATRDHLFRLAGQLPPGRGLIENRLSPSVQRLLDRLHGVPVAVYDAMWTLIAANAEYDALMGDTSLWVGNERNAVWRNLVGPGTRTAHTPKEREALVHGLVADLRRTTGRYPDDPRPARLVHELGEASTDFGRLWAALPPSPEHATGRAKVIAHPEVGRIALECDTLVVSADDIRLMVYTAEPGTPDAERLALALVVGTQSLVD